MRHSLPYLLCPRRGARASSPLPAAIRDPSGSAPATSVPVRPRRVALAPAVPELRALLRPPPPRTSRTRVGSSSRDFPQGPRHEQAVACELAAAYDSAIVDRVRARLRTTRGACPSISPRVRFCYGVDRAVTRLPGAPAVPRCNVFLTGEIIQSRQRSASRRGYPLSIGR